MRGSTSQWRLVINGAVYGSSIFAGAHDRPVALVWYRDHVAGSQQARTQRALLPLHVLAIDGRGVLLELWHVAVDCEPATLEARVIWLGLGLGLGLG